MHLKRQREEALDDEQVKKERRVSHHHSLSKLDRKVLRIIVLYLSNTEPISHTCKMLCEIAFIERWKRQVSHVTNFRQLQLSHVMVRYEQMKVDDTIKKRKEKEFQKWFSSKKENSGDVMWNCPENVQHEIGEKLFDQIKYSYKHQKEVYYGVELEWDGIIHLKDLALSHTCSLSCHSCSWSIHVMDNMKDIDESILESMVQNQTLPLDSYRFSDPYGVYSDEEEDEEGDGYEDDSKLSGTCKQFMKASKGVLIVNKLILDQIRNRLNLSSDVNDVLFVNALLVTVPWESAVDHIYLPAYLHFKNIQFDNSETDEAEVKTNKKKSKKPMRKSGKSREPMNMQDGTSILELPDDTLRCVLDYVRVKYTKDFALTCKTFYHAYYTHSKSFFVRFEQAFKAVLPYVPQIELLDFLADLKAHIKSQRYDIYGTDSTDEEDTVFAKVYASKLKSVSIDYRTKYTARFHVGPLTLIHVGYCDEGTTTSWSISLLQKNFQERVIIESNGTATAYRDVLFEIQEILNLVDWSDDALVEAIINVTPWDNDWNCLYYKSIKYKDTQEKHY
jgi:hypothetical protein